MTCKIWTADLKLIDNLIVSRDTSTVCGELSDWTAASEGFWFEEAMERMRGVSDTNDQLLMSPHEFYFVRKILGARVPRNPVWETLCVWKQGHATQVKKKKSI